MTDYQMRKKLIEAFMKSDAYSMMTPKAREQQIRIFADDRGLTDQTKRNNNSDYYEQNKETILATKNKKVECKLCGLMVSNQNVKKHPTTKLCKEVSKKVNELQEEIERLKKIITDNNLKI